MIVDDATGKSATTVTHSFLTFLGAVDARGKPACLRTHNASDFTNNEFQRLMADNNTHREFTSVDGAKRNGRVEQKVLVSEGVCQRSRSVSPCSMAWSFRPRHSTMDARDRKHGRECATRSTSWCGWMKIRTECAPSRSSTREHAGAPYGRTWCRDATRSSGQPRRRRRKEHCFYLNSGNDYASDCSNIIMSPSGVVGYSSYMMWGYRRVPFMGEWTTASGETGMAGQPPPEKRGSDSAPAQQPEAPRGFEV